MGMIKKRVVTRINSKNVFNGDHSKVTSQGTPLSHHRELARVHEILSQLESRPLPVMPQEPMKVMPQILPAFRRMGNIMGICPYELQEIMRAEFTADQEMVLGQLKNFISMAKLSGAVDLEPVHKSLRQAEANFRATHSIWEQNCQKIEKQNAEHKSDVENTTKKFMEAWGTILIDLVTKIDRNSKLSDLPEWDGLMVLAIQAAGDKYCKVVNDVVILNFQTCQKMPRQTIMSLKSMAAKIQKERADERWAGWVRRASLESLMKRLLRDQDDDGEPLTESQLEDLEYAVIAKSGRFPVRDHRGRICWHSTFQENVWSGDDPLEVDREELMNSLFYALNEAREAKKASRQARVKSGSGKGIKPQ